MRRQRLPELARAARAGGEQERTNRGTNDAPLHLALTRSYDLLWLLQTHDFMYKTLKNNKFASFILRFHRIFCVITHLFSVDRVQNSNNWGLNSYSTRPLKRFPWWRHKPRLPSRSLLRVANYHATLAVISQTIQHGRFPGQTPTLSYWIIH